MKNLLPLLLLLTLITFKLEAQVTKTVDLVTPGTLSTLLSSTEKSTVTNLIITGNLNAQDFKCLRDEVSELAVLDLSNTSIKAYNGTNGTHPGVSAYPDNQLPQYSFYTYTGISKDKLVQINLPNSITSIGNHSFYSCKGLTSISIPNTVTSIGDYAFQQCSAMKSITLGSGLQTIGDQGLYKTGLKVINSLSTVPPALGQFALEYNYISIVYVPSSSVSLYKSAAGWQTLPITSDELVSVNNTTAGALAATLTSSGYQLSSISKLKISGNLNSADFEQIKNNMPLIMELDITDASIQGNSIPTNAFYGKNIITKVKLPSTIENIGDNAFSSCSNLADILPLPSSLKTIGSSSFANCYSLTGNLVIPNTVTSIGNYAFNGCKGFNGNLILSDKLTSIPIGAFAGCTFLSGILNIPNSVTAIGTSAFFNCNKINELVIGNNCDSIGDEAFQRATSLSKITVFNPNPPAISASSFNVVPKSQVSVFVPLQSVGSFKSNTNWSVFPSINPISANGTFSITLQVLSGGSVSVNSVNQSNGSILYVEKDSTVTYTITPNVGYEIATILYDEIDVISQVTNGTFTTPALTANTTLSVSFRKITYKIHLSVSGGGVLKENSTILTDGTELIADKNSVRTFTVLPDEGYEIDTLFFGGVDVKTRLTGNQFITDPIVSNDTLKVTFKSSTAMYDIHVINGGNGKVLLGNDTLKNDTVLSVKVNATRTFTFTPDTGYEIATLMYQGSDVKTQLINNQFTIPAVTANGILSITFRKLSFEITIEVNSGGQILENAINLSNGTKLTADYNSTKTFVIVPSTDYEIATVTYGGLDVKSQLSNNQFTTPAISSNKTLSVTFKKISFKIKIFKGSGGQLIENSINLANGASVEAEKNTKKVFTINPGDGFELATLTYNGEDVKSQVVNNKYTTPSVISNDTLSVTFRQIVKIKQYGITFLIGNGGTITSGNLLITNNSILDIDSASVRTFTFVPEAGLEVATLTYGGKNVKSDLNNNQFTIPPITSNSTLSVTFRVITSTYEIAIHIGKGGSMKESNKILENNSIIEVLEDSVKTFTITPDVGYEVDSLYFGGLDVKSKLIDGSYTTDSIKSPGTLKVTFKKQILNIKLLKNSGGTIKLDTLILGNDTSVTTEYGSKLTFSITPDVGYVLDSLNFGGKDVKGKWIDNVFTTDSIIASDTLKVAFKKQILDVKILANSGGTVKLNTLVLRNDTVVSTEFGSMLTFSIIPDVGYELVSLNFGGENVTSKLIDNVFTTDSITKSDTLHIAFKKIIFDVLVQNNKGGSIQLNSVALENDTLIAAEYGSKLIFTLVPDEGYELDSLTFGGIDIMSKLADNVFTSDSILKSDTLKAVFKKIIFDVKILTNSGGTIKLDTLILGNDTSVTTEYGSKLTFSITPDLGYVLDSLNFGGKDVKGKWIDNVFTTDSIIASDTLKVAFKKQILDVKILTNSGGTVKLDTLILRNDTIVSAEYGSQLKFSIIPDEGYELDSLAFGGKDVKADILDNVFTTDTILKADTLQAVFRKKVFDVKILANSGGTVKLDTLILANDTVVSAEYGSQLKFSIIPDEGYELDSLAFGGQDVKADILDNLFSTDTILKADTLQAVFRIKVFDVKILANSGGTVKLDTLILANDTSVTAEYGSKLTFTIIPNTGFELDSLYLGNADLKSNLKNDTLTISSVIRSDTLKIIFAKKKFDIKILSNTGGKIRLDTTLLKNDTTVTAEYGTKLSFTITPDEGYELDSLNFGSNDVKGKWIDNIFTTDSIIASDTLKVAFKKQILDVKILTNSGGTIKLDTLILGNNTSVTTEYGSKLTFSITPDLGYVLDSLNFGGKDVKGKWIDNVFTTDSIIASDTLKVAFKKQILEVKILANSGGTVKLDTLILRNDTVVSAEYGSVLKFSIIPDVGYEPDSILFGGENIAGRLIDSVFTTDSITKSDTLKVAFKKIIFDVLVQNNKGGSIQLNSVALENDTLIAAEYGSKLIFTLVPDEGYELDSLTFGGIDIMSKLADNVFTSDSILKSDTLKAVFKKIIFDVNIQVSTGGSATLGTTELFNGVSISTEYGSTLEFSITPDKGYEIDSVHFGGKDVMDQLNQGVFVTASLYKADTLKVVFRKQVFDITIQAGTGGHVKLNTSIIENDTVIKAEYGSLLKFTIVAAEGFLIEKISFNGQILEISSDSLVYTISSISENGTFEVIFKNATSAPTVTNPYNIKVYPVASGIAVDGVSVGDTIRVFTLSGAQVANTRADSESVIIPIELKNMYLVNVKGSTFKVILR